MLSHLATSIGEIYSNVQKKTYAVQTSPTDMAETSKEEQSIMKTVQLRAAPEPEQASPPVLLTVEEEHLSVRRDLYAFTVLRHLEKVVITVF